MKLNIGKNLKIGKKLNMTRAKFSCKVNVQENGCCNQKQGRTNNILLTDYIVVGVCFIFCELFVCTFFA